MGRFKDLQVRWPWLESAVEATRPYLPPLNFITLHYAYFLSVCAVFTLVFWGSSDPKLNISFVDSLYCVVSAMTEAGMNTVSRPNRPLTTQAHTSRGSPALHGARGWGRGFLYLTRLVR